MNQNNSYLIIFCTIFFMLLPNPPLQSQTKGGRWQFENNGFDTASWDAIANNGELQGTAIYGNTEPVQEGTAYLWLDSANKYDFFKINDSNDLDFDNENIAISAWIYPLVVGDDVHWILNKGDQFSNPKTTNYSLRISKTKNLEFLIRDANNQARPIASSFEIPINQWTFVAIFYDYSAGKIFMWNDPLSNPIDTLDFKQSFFSNNDPLAIGSWYTSNPAVPSVKDFEGRVDDVRISGRLEDIFSDVSAVKSFDDEPGVVLPNHISIYPNPVVLANSQNYVTVQLKGTAIADPSIQIFNILGREVYHAALSNRSPFFKWDLKNRFGITVPPGIYFVKLKVIDKFYVNKFLVIN